MLLAKASDGFSLAKAIGATEMARSGLNSRRAQQMTVVRGPP